jgi:hypothetical protein
MAKFRLLSDLNPHLINNYRPTQRMNGRMVYDMDSSRSSGSSRTSSSSSSVFTTLVVVLVAALTAAECAQ